MKSIKSKIITTFILCTSILSCKKDFSATSLIDKGKLDQSKVYRYPNTEKEKQLVRNLELVSIVLKELYKNQSNIKIVNAAVFSKIYSDESILLKDLIFYNNSQLNKNKEFQNYCKKWELSLEKFSTEFWEKAKNLNSPNFDFFLRNLNNTYSSSNSNLQNASQNSNSGDGNSYGDQVTVYFPYSENFEPVIEGEYYAPITSLVTATADADEGWGELPYYINGVFQYYIPVVVNDDYAYANPTHIIGLNGVEPYDIIASSTPPPPVAPPGVNRVYVGDGLCRIQYDRFISFTGNGGGSEIKYCRLSGYLQPINGQVSSFQDIISVNFSRNEIRNEYWRNLSAIWDDDWVNTDIEQVFAIYEEDNTNTKTFNGSLATTVSVPATSTAPAGNSTGTIGFSVTVQSQDEIIRQLKITRNSYFSGAYQDQGLGYSGNTLFLPLPIQHGWPFYDAKPSVGANVGWTWPYNIY